MLKIYGSDLSSPSNKVRFVANALGLEYDYIKINLREGEHKKPEFLKINPVGKIPAINDDGFILFESNAIIKYLADKSQSSLYPKDLKERAVVDEWIEFTSHHVYQAISKIVYNRFFAKRINVPVDERSLADGLAWVDRFFPIVDNQLAKNQFLAGHQMTLADLNLLAAFDPVEIADIDISKYTHIIRWRNALKQKDFYTKCYKEFGEFLKQPATK